MGHGAGLLDIHKAELAMALRGKSPHRRLLEIEPRHFDWGRPTRLGLGDASRLIGEVTAPNPRRHRPSQKPVAQGLSSARARFDLCRDSAASRATYTEGTQMTTTEKLLNSSAKASEGKSGPLSGPYFLKSDFYPLKHPRFES